MKEELFGSLKKEKEKGGTLASMDLDTILKDLDILELIVDDLLKEKFGIDMVEIGRKNKEYVYQKLRDLKVQEELISMSQEKMKKEEIEKKNLRKTRKYRQFKNKVQLKRDKEDRFQIILNKEIIGFKSTKIEKNPQFDFYESAFSSRKAKKNASPTEQK